MKRTNPFYHRVPIQEPAYFFGRANELRRISGLIANGQSVALDGPRRIGKSSLLAQLRELGRGVDQATAVGQTIIYFSGEAWQDQPVDVLYATLWAAIVDALDLPDPAAETLDFPTFQRMLRQCQSSNRQLVLLLDEFDALSHNRHLDEFFFSSLRSLAATQGIVFVTASTQPLLELTYAQQSALSSPFFNIFLPQRLGLLSGEEARLLLKGTAAHGGLALTDQEQEQLLRLAGPHPCFLQIAGYHFWIARQEGWRDDTARLEQAILDELSPHLRYRWRYLTPDDQRALALLSVNAAGTPAQQIHLQQSCLIQSERGEIIVLSPLVARFVRGQLVHQLIQAGPLLIDQQRQKAWLAGQPLILSPQDLRLLSALAAQAETTVTYAVLANQLWPDEAIAINYKTRLKTAVSSLRRKLSKQAGLIAADPKGGYRFVVGGE